MASAFEYSCTCRCVSCGSIWHHQVETFAARELGPWTESLVLENLVQSKCRIHYKRPLNSFPRIEIKDQRVRTLNIGDGSCPRVKLYDPHIDQAKQSFDAIDPKSNP